MNVADKKSPSFFTSLIGFWRTFSPKDLYMCGIAGYYNTGATIFSPDDLREMAHTLRHRGPDASGFYNDTDTGLAHTRLSIIDLNDSANQPMTSACGRYVIVFNGEVYNYDELARESRLNLRTKSDTEVVLNMFIKLGTGAFELFNGMFALAIYDRAEKKLWLARDRMGKKPLFYYSDGATFAFASELKALMAIPCINDRKAINNKALQEFLHLGYVPHDGTIWKNIYKFPPGCLGHLVGNNLDIKSFWRLEDRVSSELITDENQAREMLRDLVTQSVRYRLKSDVPFGTFLSGGIDSSLVTAVAQRQLNTRLDTFSIAFDDTAYNEAPHARKIAQYLGTNHHELVVTHQDATKLVETMLDLYDEPFADSSAIPTLIVSRMARQHVTMILSGDGGDELFMGYGMYNWANRLSNPTLKSTRKIVSMGMQTLGNRYKRAAMVVNYPHEETIKSHIFSQEQYLFSREEARLITEPTFRGDFSLDEDFKHLNRQLTPREQQAFFDMKYYLPDDLLVKVDRASMFYSLETRVPLLDHNIVEFSLNLDESLKVKSGIQKYLLKQVLYDFVPAELFNRPKWGFSIPLKEWLKGDMKYLVDDYLNQGMIERHGIFDTKQVERLKERFYHRNHDFLYNRLWQLIVVQRFMQRNFD